VAQPLLLQHARRSTIFGLQVSLPIPLSLEHAASHAERPLSQGQLNMQAA
jgi:hypothetical protein